MTAFNKPYAKRERFQKTTTGPTMTEQSHKKECDINQIMSKFQKTGILTHSKQYEPQYGYASDIDFLEAMTIVTKGQEMFADLPSSLRTRFANDPANFLNFINDPENEEEARKIGLLPKKVPEEKAEPVVETGLSSQSSGSPPQETKPTESAS